MFLSLSVLIFSLLRLPSVVEPYWYGDEGIYHVIGVALREGRVLYSEIWDNKPPLLYYIYAAAAPDQFLTRFVSLIFGAGAVIAFYFLAQKLFKERLAVYASTGFFAVIFGLPVIEGNIANAENFMLAPIILAFLLVVSSKASDTTLKYAIAGTLLSAAFLTKIVAIFDFAALLIFILTLKIMDRTRFEKTSIAAFVGAFIAPIILVSIYFISQGAFGDFLNATFSQNVGYVGYGNKLLFPMGLLLVKLLLLTASIVLIIKYRKILTASGVLILIWLAFSLFSALFSARPYTHYLLVLLPAVSLLAGYILDNKKLMKISIPLLLIILVVIFQTFKPNFRKITPYYLNYLSFITGSKSVTEYQAFFDRKTPRDYALASFIRSKTSEKDNIFLWSDSGQIYALSGKLPPGRYIVAYHITFYPEAVLETEKALDELAPKYIIQTKDDNTINNFLSNYELRYVIEDARIYERKF